MTSYKQINYRQMMNKRKLINLIREYPIIESDDLHSDAILFDKIDEEGFLIHKSDWYKTRNVRFREKILNKLKEGFKIFWRYYQFYAAIVLTAYILVKIYGN